MDTSTNQDAIDFPAPEEERTTRQTALPSVPTWILGVLAVLGGNLLLGM